MAEAPKSPATGRIRAERLEIRVTADQKQTIEHAAALEGRTVTDFVLTSLQDAARRANMTGFKSGVEPRAFQSC
jgi:hypothetical protein